MRCLGSVALFTLLSSLFSCEQNFTIHFDVEKVEREIGELFAIHVTAKNEDGQEVQGSNVEIGLTTKQRQSEKTRPIGKQEPTYWDIDSIFCRHIPDLGILTSNGISDYYCIKELEGRLIAALMIDDKRFAEASIPIVITANTGIKGDFSLDKEKKEVTLQVRNASAGTKYDVVVISKFLAKETTKEMDVRDDRMGEVSFLLPKQIDTEKECSAVFIARVTPSDGSNDTSRIFTNLFEFPCLEGDGEVVIDKDGLVSVVDVHADCRSSRHVKTTISWFYAEYDEYPNGKISGKLELEGADLASKKTDLGTISNYNPSSCYYIAAEMYPSCRGSGGGSSSGTVKMKVGGGC